MILSLLLGCFSEVNQYIRILIQAYSEIRVAWCTVFGVGHIQSSKVCYHAGSDCLGHMQMKFVIELIILNSVLKIFCPAFPLNVRAYLKYMNKLQK